MLTAHEACASTGADVSSLALVGDRLRAWTTAPMALQLTASEEWQHNVFVTEYSSAIAGELVAEGDADFGQRHYRSQSCRGALTLVCAGGAPHVVGVLTLQMCRHDHQTVSGRR